MFIAIEELPVTSKRTNSVKKNQSKKSSRANSLANKTNTTVKGDIQGVVYSGVSQGSVKIDNRKIKARNYIEGGKGNQIVDVASAKNIDQLFAMLKQRVDAMGPTEEKEDAQNAISKLEAEAVKGDKADETRVQKWLNFLADTAPDIWEVAVDTFLNPVKGLSTVFRKIAERSKAAKQTG
jgi:hypothetical protein